MLNEAGLRFLQPFLFTTNLSGTPFDDDLGAMQTLARAAGFLACPPHVTALPTRVDAALDKPQQASSMLCSPVLLKGLKTGR